MSQILKTSCAGGGVSSEQAKNSGINQRCNHSFPPFLLLGDNPGFGRKGDHTSLGGEDFYVQREFYVIELGLRSTFM